MSWSCKSIVMASLLAVLNSNPAHAGAMAELSVHDTRDGRARPSWHYQGRRYVVGEPGSRYEIRVRNLGYERLLAVTSVDGVNVLSGETANPQQSGYVLDPYGQVRITGWRKSLAEVAAFYFTPLRDSYAARTARPQHVGVIGVALFRENRSPCCAQERDAEIQGAAPTTRRESRARTETAPLTDRSARVGTGHGERLIDDAREVRFERASSRPAALLTIYYDSYANLLALGVIPSREPRLPPLPRPFPQLGFVPDP